jgi:hypothetical protein
VVISEVVRLTDSFLSAEDALLVSSEEARESIDCDGEYEPE